MTKELTTDFYAGLFFGALVAGLALGWGQVAGLALALLVIWAMWARTEIGEASHA